MKLGNTLYDLVVNLRIILKCVLTFRNHASYRLYRTGKPLPFKNPIYIFFQQIYVLNFLNILHTLWFFLFKVLFMS
jgi:hypothetical protein